MQLQVFAFLFMIAISGQDATAVTSVTRAEQAIGSMFVSHAYPGHGAVDLIGIEVQAIRQFLISSRTSPQEKSLLLVRYSIGDQRVVDVLLLALQMKIRHITIITDLNTALDVPFAAAENKTSDFSRGTPKASLPGQTLSRLLKAGFKFNDGRYRILSQPIYNVEKVRQAPIMHEKELLMYTGSEEAPQFFGGYFGTANMSGSERYNRLFEIHDTRIMSHILMHSQHLVDAYSKGRDTKDAETTEPLRAEFSDGSFYELAFTNGRVNLNDRITNLFRAGIEGMLKIENVLFSHYVLTFSEQVTALRELMERQKSTTIDGVFDQQFLSTRGYGQAGALVGFWVERPMGVMIDPFPPDTLKRIHLFGYQRALSQSRGQPPPDSPMSFFHLWHDKTTVVTTREEKDVWSYIFTGSLNDSGHFQNAEIQMQIKTKGRSHLAADIRNSILGVARLEGQYALPLDVAIVRDTMAKVVGVSVKRFSVDDVRAIIESVNGLSPDLLRTRLMKNLVFSRPLLKVADDSKIPGEFEVVSKSPDREEAIRRVSALANFIEWYAHRQKALELPRLTVPMFEHVASQVLDQRSDELRDGLRTIWADTLPAKRVEETVKEAAQCFHL